MESFRAREREAPKKRAQTMPRRPLPLPNSTIDAGGGWKDFRFFSRYLSWCKYYFLLLLFIFITYLIVNSIIE